MNAPKRLKPNRVLTRCLGPDAVEREHYFMGSGEPGDRFCNACKRKRDNNRIVDAYTQPAHAEFGGRHVPEA